MMGIEGVRLMDYIRLGALLRDARNAAHYTQDDAAKKIGKTPQSVSLWEKGKTKIDIEALASLCQMYGIPIDTMLIEAGADLPTPTKRPEDPLQKSLLLSFSQLNKEGQERLVETADDMVSSGKYMTTRPIPMARAAARGGGIKTIPADAADAVSREMIPTDNDLL